MLQSILCALQNRVLDIKNYHLLVSDKEQRAVGAEMHKNNFSCLKEFRVSGNREWGTEKTAFTVLPAELNCFLLQTRNSFSHFRGRGPV